MLPPGPPDLLSLDLLDSIAELGSLGQAASRHGMSQPAVSMRMLIRAGSASDPKDKLGLAHLLSSLLDQGTTTKSAQELNDAIDFIGGLVYPATTGYDMASGLGAPLVAGVGSGGSYSMFYPGLAAIMCAAYATKLTATKVTKIAPATGSTKGGTTVTITGTGFLPIAGADEALVGTTYVAANCTTSTKCTIVTPKHAAGTVNIQITAEDFALSPITTKDKFKYTG